VSAKNEAKGERQTGVATVGDAFGHPYLVALLEAQPLPMMLFDADGSLIMSNSAVEHLLVPGPGGSLRIIAQDGTDLWTIIAARADEAAPLFDVRLRVRLSDMQGAEAMMTVLPFRGERGALAGALVLVLNVPSERLRDVAPTGPAVGPRDFESVLAHLGSLTSAARVAVLEVDPDYSSEAHILSLWAPDDDPYEGPRSMTMRHTVLDSFSGRRLVCIPSDLAAAFPDDPMMAGSGYESCVGVALSDPEGDEVGVLIGVWRRPLTDIAGTSAAFSIVAWQVAQALGDLMAKRELKESEQRYGAVFEGSAVPILLVEPDTTQVVDANPAACKMYHYPHEEFVTMSVLQIDALASEVVHEELQRALKGNRSNFIARHLLGDGESRDVEVNIGPIAVGGRQLLYMMINDITERKRMEAELERSRRGLEVIVGQRTEDLLRANAELQQASTARDMVFVSLAQELRTSLQTITGFSDLLASGAPGELNREQHRQVEMIQQAGKRLAAFAASLMETRKLAESEMACEPDEVDLVSLAESVLFGLSAFAEDKGLKLVLEADERPVTVTTDRYKLQQIILNLLSNAIRYTERGGVTVTIDREPDGPSHISVADTGPGLSARQVATLFVGPEIHNSAAGIGLPTSRRIASTLGGSITVTSEPQKGSVFTLTIPQECHGPAGDIEE